MVVEKITILPITRPHLDYGIQSRITSERIDLIRTQVDLHMMTFLAFYASYALSL